jgi:hypothetical protein
MSLNDENLQWQRLVGILDPCWTLAILIYGEGKKQRGEYYIDLAGQYYSELIEKARRTDWSAKQTAA